jgi:hypothetical protein
MRPEYDAADVRLRIRRACGIRHSDCSTISQRRVPEMTLCHLTQIVRRMVGSVSFATASGGLKWGPKSLQK